MFIINFLNLNSCERIPVKTESLALHLNDVYSHDFKMSNIV